MFECRKIYGNLLLLSVIVFTLGASCRPAECCVFGNELSWQTPAQAVDFKWDNRSGAIVYRGGQIKAVFGNEFIGLLPTAQDEVQFFAVYEPRWGEDVLSPEVVCWQLPDSRGPPDIMLQHG